ncbi:DUF308 domain-containing protein [Actinoplanes bogorensis]|uniref:DUF308 domain-containing protein n=1 Tax=Paractinoplanes bogorensis TaxID=1610840 RepID=A0ABS5YPE5_9ACTN|nr:DUF308 domain-containing protein [Actinoplanes bogorensis]MBU2663870.1 DUF308 domain-containing protein [Actinoplanes bogorensis]
MSSVAREVKKVSTGAIIGGILLALLGALGLAYTWIATITSVALFGWLMVGAGVVATIAAIVSVRRDNRPSFGVVLLTGPLTIVGGVVILSNLGASIAGITLAVAVVLIGIGIMRIVTPMVLNGGRSVWSIISGVCSIVLGVMAMFQWPESSLYLIGTLVSVNVLIDGINLLTVGSLGHRTSGAIAAFAR